MLHIAGVPYQYVGGTENTVTWDQAPTAVIGAREVILQRMRQALGINGSFNEVLSAAYMEKQKMAVIAGNSVLRCIIYLSSVP